MVATRGRAALGALAAVVLLGAEPAHGRRQSPAAARRDPRGPRAVGHRRRRADRAAGARVRRVRAARAAARPPPPRSSALLARCAALTAVALALRGAGGIARAVRRDAARRRRRGDRPGARCRSTSAPRHAGPRRPADRRVLRVAAARRDRRRRRSPSRSPTRSARGTCRSRSGRCPPRRPRWPGSRDTPATRRARPGARAAAGRSARVGGGALLRGPVDGVLRRARVAAVRLADDAGYSRAAAGLLLALSSLASIPSAFLLPVLAARRGARCRSWPGSPPSARSGRSACWWPSPPRPLWMVGPRRSARAGRSGSR